MLTLSDTCFAKWRQGFVFYDMLLIVLRWRYYLFSSWQHAFYSNSSLAVCLLSDLQLTIKRESWKYLMKTKKNLMKNIWTKWKNVKLHQGWISLFYSEFYNESAYCICVIECKISWFLLVHYYSIYLIILNKKLEIWVWTKYWYRSQDLVPSLEDLLVWTSVPPFPISYLVLKLHLNFYIEAFPMNTDH